MPTRSQTYGIDDLSVEQVFLYGVMRIVGRLGRNLNYAEHGWDVCFVGYYCTIIAILQNGEHHDF